MNKECLCHMFNCSLFQKEIKAPANETDLHHTLTLWIIITIDHHTEGNFNGRNEEMVLLVTIIVFGASSSVTSMRLLAIQ